MQKTFHNALMYFAFTQRSATDVESFTSNENLATVLAKIDNWRVVTDAFKKAYFKTTTSSTINLTGTTASSASRGDLYTQTTLKFNTSTNTLSMTNMSATGTATFVTQSASDNSTKAATTAYVTTAVNNALVDIGNAMVFKGTVNTSSSELPTGVKTGWTYKIIGTSGTTITIPTGASTTETGKPGDTIICQSVAAGSTPAYWCLIPSGDEPSGTVTSVGLGADTNEFTITGSPITSSGTFNITHANSITAGSKKLYSFAYDAHGHVTGTPTEVTTLKNPTSLTVKWGATPTTSWSYDGSTARTLTIAGSGSVSVSGNTSGTITITGTDTTYTGTSGISINASTHVISHSNSITAGSVASTESTTVKFGDTVTVPKVAWDAQGHLITSGTGSATFNIPATVGAKDVLGLVKTTSTVTSTSGLVASPIISGVVYYKDTTYSDFTGSTASANGTHGLVTAPQKGGWTEYTTVNNQFLCGDGTWSTKPVIEQDTLILYGVEDSD